MPEFTLTLTAGGRPLAVPPGDILEVVRVPAASPVPLAPAWLIGLINHRGAIVPMIDLAARLGEVRRVPTAQSRAVIASAGAAFLVEAVESGGAADAEPVDLAALLTSDAPVAGQRAAAGAGSRAEAKSAEDEDAEPLLGIIVAGEAYAFALHSVEEASVFAEDAAEPGTMMWRGERLPALSLRDRLGAPADGAAGEQRVAVLRLADGARAAVRVDAFAGILRVPPRQRHAVPPLLARGRPMLDSLCPLDGGARLVCVLSAERLLERDGSRPSSLQPAWRASPPAPDADPQNFIIIRLGAARFAAPLQAIDAVLRDAPLAPVPCAPAYVAGVRRLRGRILPVIDLRSLTALGGAEAEPGTAPKTLVCTLDDDLQVGFLVDGVERILAVAPHDIRPAPGLPAAAHGLVTHGLTATGGSAPLPVLDLSRLFAALPDTTLASVLAAASRQAA